jgi:hypothetical protein
MRVRAPGLLLVAAARATAFTTMSADRPTVVVAGGSGRVGRQAVSKVLEYYPGANVR